MTFLGCYMIYIFLVNFMINQCTGSASAYAKMISLSFP